LQFAGQEPGANSEILNILKYVRPGGGFVPSFPLTEIINVNGAFADPIWSYIRGACPSPVSDLSDITPAWTPITTSDITWNFNAVLFNKNGIPYKRYDTLVQPQQQIGDIQLLLAQ
jgi:glutathione peroxidase